MPNQFNFTKPRLDKLDPQTKRYRVRDATIPTLYMNVLPSGHKSFAVIQRPKGGKPMTVTLGSYPQLSLPDARAMARDTTSDIISGNLYKHEVLRMTVSEAYDKYLSAKRLTEQTDLSYRKTLSCVLKPWQSKTLANVTPKDVTTLYLSYSKQSPSQANRAMRVFRAIYNYHRAGNRDASRNYILPENPVSVLSEQNLWVEVRRKKSMIRAEDLPIWVAALERLRTEYNSGNGPVLYALFRTMLFTGRRGDELRSLRSRRVSGCKGYYDSGNHLIYLFDQKNHEETEIPLSSHVQLNPGKDWVFESKDGTQLTYDVQRGAVDWLESEIGLRTPGHDLRRTFITVAESLDISHYTYKRLVGHTIAGNNRDVTGGYVVPEKDRLRRAAQMIGNAIESASSRAI